MTSKTAQAETLATLSLLDIVRIVQETSPGAGTYQSMKTTFAAVKALLVSQGATPTVPVDFKDSVAVASTANLTLSGEQTIDGILTSASRILVKDQTTKSANGIYVTAAGAWSRATDADTSGEVTGGMLVYVDAGTVNGDQLFTLVTNGTITLNTTLLDFAAIAPPATSTLMIGKLVSGTTYTHILSDSGKRLIFTNAAAKTFTLALQASVNSAVNTEIEGYNAGAGMLTLSFAGTLNGPIKIPAGGFFKLKKRANPNTWDNVATVQSRAVFALTDGATIAVDAANYDNFRVTLGGNRTLGNPTNVVDGQVLNFRFIQDGTGSRTLTLSSKYKTAGGTAIVLSIAAGAKDFMSAQYDATDDTLYCSLLKAFA